MKKEIKVGQQVVFTSFEDEAWGVEYGGKTAYVVNVDGTDVDIRFIGGHNLTVQEEEVMIVEDISE